MLTAREKRQKEVIKNNMPQFTAWINDTYEVLVGSFEFMEDSSLGIYTWKPVTSINDFCSYDTKFVINDDEDRVELRKGLAEGKQLLFFDSGVWVPIENTIYFNGEQIDENYHFDFLLEFIGMYKIGERKN